MIRFAAVLAALAMSALSLGGAAVAADPAGDWIGTLHTSKDNLVTGLEVRRTPGGYEARYDAITGGIWGLPTTLAHSTGALTFEIKAPFGTFTFTWNPAADDWTGLWHDKYGDYPMTLRRGAIPPAPLLSRSDEIILAVAAVLIVLEAGGIAWLLQRRRRRVRARTA